ncbi:peptidoglycan bridge formation glycyltransferase FemA/FemB family protein [Paenarthrobacter sp. PH39-S1]|uniref:lipid II:glycine glycyltransferase FemX n=1 Tax=Paenarthrobacter sp. PH39-S1 TaxID=3046204 RepID=UPI0024BBA8A7|nr:peptidoglycan bridge formation glycyltransferase FemA/FemB family protein [Paenarthrobacter sp. PH39-S1]MDJ0354539.1 peptidoglycan bridge formation glycyltransferase FemA/FemB family protein [Paenarthrobacter sp. PH39-S1]
MPEFTARFASPAEIAGWDAHVTANPNGGNLLQSEAFAEVKSDYGWKPLYLVYESSDYRSYNLVLEKSFPVLGRLWYLIKGPDAADVADIRAMMTATVGLIKRARLNVFAVKIEPDIVDGARARAVLADAGLVKTFNLQPNDSTAILDISPEENQLLRNLHSRGRNAVRRALREGVEVRQVEPTEQNLTSMYVLMAGTIAEKGSTQIRDYGYYRRFWNGFIGRGQGRLYFVYEDNRPSVGAFVINYGNKGTYKDGGSLQKRSQYGDSHLVQWVAINAIKELGVTEYDFCGTPPADRLKDPSHPHHGLGMFKTSFTKTVTDFVGCYDLAVRPLTYKAWTVAGERLFRQLYTRRTGKQFY